MSVRQKNDKIYVATGSNEIQILSHPEGERDGILTRATDPFNQIAVCKNQNVSNFFLNFALGKKCWMTSCRKAIKMFEL